MTYVDVNGLPTWHMDRLVLNGQYYNSSGKVAGGLVDQLGADGDQVMGFLRAEYDLVSPDGPEHFPVVYTKTMRMLATEPELDLSSLAAVAAPTLVLQGDRDEVTLEHGAAVAAALPHGRLAVLPGSHALPVENPAVVNTLLLWFSQERLRPSPGPIPDRRLRDTGGLRGPARTTSTYPCRHDLAFPFFRTPRRETAGRRRRGRGHLGAWRLQR